MLIDVLADRPADNSGDHSTHTSGDDQVSAPTSVDGRRARRERNREAVVDALLAFYREGEFSPSTDQIAARAGLSPRSLFRYFDDVDELCRIAIDHQRDRIAHLVAIDVDPSAPLAERTSTFVQHRVALYEAQSGVGLVARTRAPFQPLIADELRRGRALLREQLTQMFAPELGSLTAELRVRRLAAADVQCSFEAYRLLLDDHGLDRDAVVAVLVEAISRLVGPPST